MAYVMLSKHLHLFLIYLFVCKYGNSIASSECWSWSFSTHQTQFNSFYLWQRGISSCVCGLCVWPHLADAWAHWRTCFSCWWIDGWSGARGAAEAGAPSLSPSPPRPPCGAAPLPRWPVASLPWWSRWRKRWRTWDLTLDTAHPAPDRTDTRTLSRCALSDLILIDLSSDWNLLILISLISLACLFTLQLQVSGNLIYNKKMVLSLY